MKLAEALIERKAVKTRMEALKQRLYQNAQVQEGLDPVEDPEVLLSELETEVKRFEEWVVWINAANMRSKLPVGTTMMEAIIRKDMRRYMHQILSNLADKATPGQQRYSQREIKQVPAVNITELRQKADETARTYRRLDAQIQELNWQIELT